MPVESVRPLAVLVAIRLPEMDASQSDASLDELSRLVTTLGYEVVQRIVQPRATLSPAAVLGEGKLGELARLTGGTGRTAPIIPGQRKAHRDHDDDLEPEDDFSAEPEFDAEAADEARAPIALVAVDHDISPSQLRNLERATGVSVLDRTGVIIEIFTATRAAAKLGSKSK